MLNQWEKDLAWNILCHFMLLYTLKMGCGFQWLYPAAVSKIKISSVGREIQARPTSPQACKPSQNSLPKISLICWPMAVLSHSQSTAVQSTLRSTIQSALPPVDIKPPSEDMVSRAAPQAGASAGVCSDVTETEQPQRICSLCTLRVMPSLDIMPWQQNLACTLQ